MSRSFRAYRTAVLTAVASLAVPGGIGVMLATSGGNSTVVTTEAAQQTRTAAAPAASSGPSAVDSSQAPSAPAEKTPKVVEKPPPVVDGVRRANVGSAHSPRIQQQLSGSPPVTPPPADAGSLGIDVADYQHPHGAPIDWPQVAAAGYRFAFVKATEGDYYVNPYYASDQSQANAAGMYATGYHFAVPNVSGGTSQADFAVRNEASAAGGRTLPVALDIEYNPYGAECYGLSAARMVSWLAAFTGEVRRLTGQLPIIYTTADWWNTCTGNSTAFGSDLLWVAAYGSGSPPLPAGWGSWTFWQYTSRGSVPGITGSVDLSYYLGSLHVTPGRPTPSPTSPPSSPAPSPFPSSPPPSPRPTTPTPPLPSASSPPPPSPSSSPTPSPSTPSPSSSPTPSPSATPSPSPSPSATPTPSASSSLTASPSQVPQTVPPPSPSSPLSTSAASSPA